VTGGGGNAKGNASAGGGKLQGLNSAAERGESLNGAVKGQSGGMYGNNAPTLSGGGTPGINNASATAGNSMGGAGNRIRLINSYQRANGLGQNQNLQREEQMLKELMVESQRLAQLARQSGDPKLAAEAEQLAHRAEQQFVRQTGHAFGGGGANLAGTGTGNGWRAGQSANGQNAGVGAITSQRR
jgi:hypothetical protein